MWVGEGRAGVAVYNSEFKTNTTNKINPTTNWLVMCGKNSLTPPNNIIANGASVGTSGGGSGNDKLNINSNYAHSNFLHEKSNFAFSVVYIWDKHLTDNEMNYVSTKLNNYLNTGILIKATPTIGTFTIPPKTYGDAPFDIVNPTSTSDGTWSYTSSNLLVATIQGSTVTIVGAGTSLITATQEATENYTSGSTETSFVVSKATPTITNFTIPPKTYGDAPFDIVNQTSTSDGTWSYTSSNTNVATIQGSTVTIVGAGPSLITGTQEATANYTSRTTETEFLVTESTFINPTELRNSFDLEYFLETNALHGNIITSMIISNVLVSNVPEQTLFINEQGIKISLSYSAPV